MTMEAFINLKKKNSYKIKKNVRKFSPHLNSISSSQTLHPIDTKFKSMHVSFKI